MSKELVTCIGCTKEFQKHTSEIKKHPRHFCSRSCAAKTNNKGKRRYPPRNCKKCSNEYITTKQHRSLTLCEDCKGICFTSEVAKQTTLGEYKNRISVKGKHPSWATAHVRGFNRSWNSNLTRMKCQCCTYSKHVELAHIKAVSEFDDTATLGEINHPNNLLVLCRNHHWEFDHGDLSLEDIPAR